MSAEDKAKTLTDTLFASAAKDSKQPDKIAIVDALNFNGLSHDVE